MRILLPILLFAALSVHGQKPEVVVSTGHTDMIHCMDISSDGKWLATGGHDKLVKIVHNSTGKELRTFADNDGRVDYVKFDDNAKYIGANLNSGEVKFWEVATGELLSSFVKSSHFGEFDFVLDNSMVLLVDKDNEVALKDYTSDAAPVKLGFKGASRVKADSEGKHAFIYDYEGNMHKMSLETKQVVQKVSLFDSLVYSPTRMDVSADGQYVAISFVFNQFGEGGEYDHIYILNTNDLSTYCILKDHTARMRDLKFDEKSGTLFSIEHNSQDIFVWNIKQKKLKERKSVVGFQSTWIEPHPTEDMIIIADWKTLLYVDRKRLKKLKVFESKANRIMNMSYDQKGKYLAAVSVDMNVKLWDLEQNRVVRSFQGFWPVAMDPTGNYVLANYMSTKIGIWDVHTGEMIDQLPTESDLIQQVAFSQDGKYVAGVGLIGVIRVWDMETRKIVQRMNWPPGMTYGVQFSPDGKYLVTSGIDRDPTGKHGFHVWNVETGKEERFVQGYMLQFTDVKFTADGSHMIACNWDKNIYMYDTKTWEEIKVFKGHTNTINTIDISPDGKYLASGAGNNSVWDADNSVIVWDISTAQPVCRYKGHVGSINKVIFDKTSDLVYSTGDDGMIKVWKYKDCQEVGTYISVNQTDYVVSTPDYYYMASKDALDAVSFRLRDELFPFDQFDLKLNRPDIVSNRLGKTPDGLIKAYEYVFKKRLRKMNFKEEDLGDDFHIPSIEIESKDVPLVTEQSSVSFDVVMRDSKYDLDRINVYVNDVPLHGITGINIKDRAVKSMKYQLDVALIPGENKIQVSVLNNKGAESLRKTMTIVRDEEAVIGDLYLITIGVSKYKDERFTLKYPVKDARDIELTLNESKKLYKNVYTEQLVDSLATVENVRQLQLFIEKAKPEDAVIIFVAGHGVLDENFDYYYGTYDMDFDDPAKRGLPYEVLDQLLLDTKAIKKLLIMDTCHSGEVDKDEVEATNNVEAEEGDVEFRAAGQGIRKKEAFGMENSAELMETMFSDIRRGSGATVISSAGGAEYAMESDKWQNGLFTYCLLAGLREFSADKDGNREIIISELKRYVSDEVMKLSNGRQRPTSRQENTSMDYRVW